MTPTLSINGYVRSAAKKNCSPIKVSITSAMTFVRNAVREPVNWCVTPSSNTPLTTTSESRRTSINVSVAARNGALSRSCANSNAVIVPTPQAVVRGAAAVVPPAVHGEEDPPPAAVQEDTSKLIIDN